MTNTETATRPTTETVTTDHLAAGDIVWTTGLRVRLGEVHTWTHRYASETTTQTVYWSKATILNPEYLSTDAGRYLYGGIIPLDGSEPWTIQGNHLAHWVREVSA